MPKVLSSAATWSRAGYAVPAARKSPAAAGGSFELSFKPDDDEFDDHDAHAVHEPLGKPTAGVKRPRAEEPAVARAGAPPAKKRQPEHGLQREDSASSDGDRGRDGFDDAEEAPPRVAARPRAAAAAPAVAAGQGSDDRGDDDDSAGFTKRRLKRKPPAAATAAAASKKGGGAVKAKAPPPPVRARPKQRIVRQLQHDEEASTASDGSEERADTHARSGSDDGNVKNDEDEDDEDDDDGVRIMGCGYPLQTAAAHRGVAAGKGPQKPAPTAAAPARVLPMRSAVAAAAVERATAAAPRGRTTGAAVASASASVAVTVVASSEPAKRPAPASRGRAATARSTRKDHDVSDEETDDDGEAELSDGFAFGDASDSCGQFGGVGRTYHMAHHDPPTASKKTAGKAKPASSATSSATSAAAAPSARVAPSSKPAASSRLAWQAAEVGPQHYVSSDDEAAQVRLSDSEDEDSDAGRRLAARKPAAASGGGKAVAGLARGHAAAAGGGDRAEQERMAALRRFISIGAPAMLVGSAARGRGGGAGTHAADDDGDFEDASIDGSSSGGEVELSEGDNDGHGAPQRRRPAPARAPAQPRLGGGRRYARDDDISGDDSDGSEYEAASMGSAVDVTDSDESLVSERAPRQRGAGARRAYSDDDDEDSEYSGTRRRAAASRRGVAASGSRGKSSDGGAGKVRYSDGKAKLLPGEKQSHVAAPRRLAADEISDDDEVVAVVVEDEDEDAIDDDGDRRWSGIVPGIAAQITPKGAAARQRTAAAAPVAAVPPGGRRAVRWDAEVPPPPPLPAAVVPTRITSIPWLEVMPLPYGRTMRCVPFGAVVGLTATVTTTVGPTGSEDALRRISTLSSRGAGPPLRSVAAPQLFLGGTSSAVGAHSSSASSRAAVLGKVVSQPGALAAAPNCNPYPLFCSRGFENVLVIDADALRRAVEEARGVCEVPPDLFTVPETVKPAMAASASAPTRVDGAARVTYSYPSFRALGLSAITPQDHIVPAWLDLEDDTQAKPPSSTTAAPSSSWTGGASSAAAAAARPIYRFHLYAVEHETRRFWFVRFPRPAAPGAVAVVAGGAAGTSMAVGGSMAGDQQLRMAIADARRGSIDDFLARYQFKSMSAAGAGPSSSSGGGAGGRGGSGAKKAQRSPSASKARGASAAGRGGKAGT